MVLSMEALQAYLYEHYGDRANEQGLFMKLVEEVGETAEILNKRAGRKTTGEGEDLGKELGNELADMIHYIVAIAAINRINLTKTMIQKDKIAAVKYHHARDLETFLARSDER